MIAPDPFAPDGLPPGRIELPSCVEGVYLVGSYALGDYRPGVSDLDFVALLRSAPAPGEIASLAAVHRALAGSRPLLDGAYLTREDLAAPPSAAPPRPGVHEHRFSPAGHSGHDPVTWHTLAHHGITVRGPEPSTLDINTDAAGLHAWVRANVDAYWRPWLRRSGPALLTDWGVAWGVLGLSRIRYTMQTSGIASKTAAGEWALTACGEQHHRILREALRLRRRDPAAEFRSRLTRARAAASFMRAAIASAE